MNQLAEALRAHTEACDALHGVIGEENRYLKGAKKVPDDALLARKRSALTSLSDTLEQLRETMRNSPDSWRPFKDAIEKTQSLIMKTMLVDRENEQLLLGCTMRKVVPEPPKSDVAPRAAAAQLQRLYKRH